MFRLCFASFMVFAWLGLPTSEADAQIIRRFFRGGQEITCINGNCQTAQGVPVAEGVPLLPQAMVYTDAQPMVVRQRTVINPRPILSGWNVFRDAPRSRQVWRVSHRRF